jgi:hypothetical protein
MVVPIVPAKRARLVNRGLPLNGAAGDSGRFRWARTDLDRAQARTAEGARRERYGFSYITVHRPYMTTVGPIIERLRG